MSPDAPTAGWSRWSSHGAVEPNRSSRSHRAAITGAWGASRSPRIAVLLTANHVAARLLRRQGNRLCSSALGRWLLFRQASAHPGRLAPDLAADLFRAIADCPDYMEILRASLRADPVELGDVACPVLVAWPSHDRLLPFGRYGRPVLRDLRALTLRPLDDVGHVAMLDDPEGTATMIGEFTEAAESRMAAGVAAPARRVLPANRGRRAAGLSLAAIRQPPSDPAAPSEHHK